MLMTMTNLLLAIEGVPQEVNVIVRTKNLLIWILRLSFYLSLLFVYLHAAMGPSTTPRQAAEKDKIENKR